MVYLDTSIVAAYYCPEKLSAAVDRVLARMTRAVISPLVELEFSSALALKVRTRELELPSACAVLAQFRVHVADGYYRFVDVGAREYEVAREWLGRFTTPLRTLDALHLAASFANRLEILTIDKSLAESAKRLGVRCRLLGP